MTDKKNTYPLSEVKQGEEVIIVALLGGQGAASRLADMGLNIGKRIKIVSLGHGKAGAVIVLAGDTRLAIGHGLADKVLVRGLSKKS